MSHPLIPSNPNPPTSSAPGSHFTVALVISSMLNQQVRGTFSARPHSRATSCHALQRPVQASRLADACAVASVLAASCAPAASAQELFSIAGVDGSALTFAVGGGAAIAGIGALLVATDPQKRPVRHVCSSCTALDPGASLYHKHMQCHCAGALSRQWTMEAMRRKR